MQLIAIVDKDDNLIGEEEKEKCHSGTGILHRAFLSMVFLGSGQLVLARRSAQKKLWPGYWDGTVASHLAISESYEQASQRRLAEEAGLLNLEPKYLFKFHYEVPYRDIGIEREICAVTVVNGIELAHVIPNSEEISEIKPVSLSELLELMKTDPDSYTPWLYLAIRYMDEGKLLAQPEFSSLRFG